MATKMVFPYDAPYGSVSAKWKEVADDASKASDSIMTVPNAKKQMDKLISEFQEIQTGEFQSGTVTQETSIQHALAPLVEKIKIFQETRVRA